MKAGRRLEKPAFCPLFMHDVFCLAADPKYRPRLSPVLLVLQVPAPVPAPSHLLQTAANCGMVKGLLR